MKSIERVLKVPNGYHHFDNVCIIMNRMSEGKTLMVDTGNGKNGSSGSEMSEGKTMMVDTGHLHHLRADEGMSEGKTLNSIFITNWRIWII